MKKLVLFTDGFPFVHSEIPFIYNELYALAEKFDIEIVARLKPQYADNEQMIDVPDNVKLHKYVIEDVAGKQKLKAIKYALSTKAFYEEIARLFKVDRRKAVFNEMYTYLTSTYMFMEWLKQEIDIGSVDLFYTYWNSYATLGLSIYKNRNSRYKLVTRTHRYDLYNERTIYLRQYFKDYVDRKIDKVFFIAEHGKEYYLENFAHSDSSKYVMNMIGVTPAKNIPKKQDTDSISMVSCSNVIGVKRVQMIAEALSLVDDIKICWTHMGAGNQFEDLKKLCEETLDGKSNIAYNLLGRVPNTDVRNYYEENYVDFFITTSASEGSPVSIQEAMAYGIPIVGTDVGEVAELATGNGIVLKEDPTVEEVTDAIKQMCSLPATEKDSMRANSYSKWQEQYNVKANAEEFVGMLEELFR